jgi:hypothetical protein
VTRLSPTDRFEALVDRAGDHHRWTGTTDPRTGTDQFRLNANLRSAQRAAWELHVGPLPTGVRVRACPDEPACVRLEHLAVEPTDSRIGPTASSAPELAAHMSASTAFPLYLAHLEHDGRSESTLEVYQSVYRGWLDRSVGNLAVIELSPAAIKVAADAIATPAPGTAAVAKSILNGLAHWAHDEGL